MEFKLERSSPKWIPSWEVELLASMSEGVITSTTTFWVKGVFSCVILCTHISICKNLFCCSNIHKLFLCCFLFFLVLKFIRMPLYSKFLVSLKEGFSLNNQFTDLNHIYLRYIFFGSATLYTEYFIIISLPRLLLQLLRLRQPLLGPGEALFLVKSCSEVIDGLQTDTHISITPCIIVSHDMGMNISYLSTRSGIN